MKREEWFRPYIRAHARRFVAIIFLGVCTALTASSLMFTSGFLISKSALRPENILLVYVPVVLVRTFGTSRAVVHYVERLIGHDTILRILSKMRLRLYQMLEPQALFVRSRFRTGDLLGVLADDIEYLQNVYLRTIFPSIVALVMYGVVLAVIGWFDAGFALLMAFLILLLLFVFPAISLMLTKHLQTDSKSERNGLYQKLTDAIMGMSDWVISGREEQFVHSYEKDEAKVARIDDALSEWSKWRNFLGQIIVGCIVVTMLFWTGDQYAMGEITVTLIAAFVLVMFPVMDIFLPISEAIEKIPQYQNSLDRLHSINSVDDRNNIRDIHPVVAEQQVQLARQDAHIHIEKVTYQYSKEAPTAVQQVSLTVPQGKKIAIIGRSGAGKSTLLKLIQGAILPTGGSVSIHGIPADQYKEHIPTIMSVLNQSPHLFDTTVGNNIRLGDLQASDEELKEVCRQVQLDRLIESLPEGYQTPMHETGQRFSGGERQRIALARILLQNTPIVLLDEPTVGLDPRTERELLRTIFKTMQGKTLIWITHHLVGAEHMDEVIFMDHGKVIMRGTHAELMEKEPRYRNLYHLDRPAAFQVK
ncbi:thiol reductant ABC exporter subunit CydC [Brevibacillus laterosporus]|nr:thiol reductant ABC exporter subunit CydC [Brevibacillus laterosporus]TPG92651.1 thiol reductant ABC exporter subunit CydC [Brevibacillus laterosporus]